MIFDKVFYRVTGESLNTILNRTKNQHGGLPVLKRSTARFRTTSLANLQLGKRFTHLQRPSNFCVSHLRTKILLANRCCYLSIIFIDEMSVGENESFTRRRFTTEAIRKRKYFSVPPETEADLRHRLYGTPESIIATARLDKFDFSVVTIRP